eukprot:TRINITY_DN17422_c0_g1_i1.p1 TRINITY_DN17422_c0_g1~~TRINITY_DN17422_c0_g1_i1.p1  ORF type:complete len:126 (-),score=33.20 TRINITY_DN17422_c0_g1_i1:11-388(-)
MEEKKQINHRNQKKSFLSQAHSKASQGKEDLAHSGKCFELFGYDVLLDQELMPHLMEVNFSPSLGCDCEIDEIVKTSLISSIFDMFDPSPNHNEDKSLNFNQIYPMEGMDAVREAVEEIEKRTRQ